MAKDTKANTLKTRSMGRALFGGLTDAHTKAAGKMESNMEKGCIARETKNGLAFGILWCLLVDDL